MILTAAQPAFLPWAGLIAKIASADMFVSFDAVPFEYHGFGNRNRVLTSQGIQWLTVPVRMDDHLSKPICEIKLIEGNWRRKHLRTIELAYQKSPYFEQYYPALKEIYSKEWKTLAGLNDALLKWILMELDIAVPIVKASEQGFEGSKSALVLDMCLKMGATEYIFGSQGRDYADVSAFDSAGVKVHFQDYKHPVYPQVGGGEFVPNLSVIDLLMNCGPDSLDIIMEQP